MTRTLTTNPQYTNASPIACHLRQVEALGRNGPLPFRAMFEIENVTASELQIEHRFTVLEHFDLVVLDARGVRVSHEKFSDRFAPTAENHLTRLAPGETLGRQVPLFATAPDAVKVPGAYTIQAVYEYNGFRAESEVVTVTVPSSV